jgi:hypothetical protein
MNKYAEPLPRSSVDAMFGAWLAVIRRKECASIISLPKFDREYRASQFVGWVQSQREKGIHVVPISLHSFVTEVWEELAAKLTALKHPTKYTVFLVTDADWLLTSAPHLISRFQSFVLSPYRSVSFLFFFERNIFDVINKPLIGHEPLFTQNVLHQSLYKKDDMSHFLRHMEHMYGFALSAKNRELIWDECRGYIWLSTEALRHAHQTKKLSFTHDAFIFRLRAIWDGFNADEQKILARVVTGKSMIEGRPEILAYFEKTGLLVNSGKLYTITVPILERFIRDIVRRERQLKLSQDGKLSMGAIVMDPVFSAKEKSVMTCLLQHQGETVSRDAVAKVVWGSGVEYDYSDWNLDQVIRRLRVRLGLLGLSGTLIDTVKGKGFRFLSEREAYGMV